MGHFYDQTGISVQNQHTVFCGFKETTISFSVSSMRSFWIPLLVFETSLSDKNREAEMPF